MHLSKDSVARAAGVTVQAVSNWQRRHSDFPTTVEKHSRSGYDAREVAAWLDQRVIHGPDLGPGELPGHTYGIRFRMATGLRSEASAGVTDRKQAPDSVQENLWPLVERISNRAEDKWLFESVVMSLVCLQAADPAGWYAISTASSENVLEAIAHTSQHQPPRLAKATEPLRRVPAEYRWRRYMLELVSALADETAPAAQVFDYLIDRFAKYRHRSPDEFLVPAELARLMVQMLDPAPGSRLHDPCCGPGSLLTTAAMHMLSNHPTATRATNLTGHAATTRAWNLATLNGFVHGTPFDIGDGPPADPGHVHTELEKYHFVLLNPPFAMQRWSREPSRGTRPWPLGEPSMHNAAFAWLQAAMEALAPGGLAAVVLPHSATMANTTRERNIREALIEKGLIHCVVALPSHLFRETTVPVTVWITADLDAPPRPSVLLVDARNSFRREAATHRKLTEGGCQAIIDVYRGWQRGEITRFGPTDDVIGTVVASAELRDHDYDLQPSTYLDERRRHTAEKVALQRLQMLPAEMARADNAAREADVALERYLDRIDLWTR